MPTLPDGKLIVRVHVGEKKTIEQLGFTGQPDILKL
jgi:hypothetical protein